MALYSIKYRDGQNYHYYWGSSSDPQDLAGGEIIGDVSESDLIARPDLAEQAWCGDGDSVRTARDYEEFRRWLLACGYTTRAVSACSRALAAHHK